MKKHNILKRLLYVLALPILLLSCDSDDEAADPLDFGSIASSYYESEGTGTLTIPLRNASNTSNIDLEFGGTATEGEDFELVGITSEGVQLSIIDDDDLEMNETIRVKFNSSGNNIHTVTIVSNCEDQDGLLLADFAGEYDATEKYGPAPADWYGPYSLEIVQDEEDPTIFHMDNFYDSGRDAYFVVDVAEGTVYFPDQTPLPDNSPNALTASSGSFSFCTDESGHLTLTIDLNYDGGDWVYEFVKH